MDVGSIFPLYESHFVQQATGMPHTGGTVCVSLCREALFIAAQQQSGSNKVVLLPAYTCNTVYLPFKQLGWTCIYYSLTENLRIDRDSFESACSCHNPSVILAHPFFGMDLNEEEICILKKEKKLGRCLVIDLTQCIFSKKDYSFADYITGSYRKWFPIPDGGFLKTTQPVEIPDKENDRFVAVQKAAMFLRGTYFRNGNQLHKDISRELAAVADEISLDDIVPHKMSDFSQYIMALQDVDMNIGKRMQNYTYLFEHLDREKVRFVCNDLQKVTSAPLYFVFYTECRSALQRRLAADKIYAPVIWPVEDDEVLVNDSVRYIYDHILAIPIDQRYDQEDMRKICSIVNSFVND